MNFFRFTLVFGFFAVPTITIAQVTGPTCMFRAPFDAYDVGDNSRCVATGDLDGNGYIDLATANTDSDDVSVLLNNGDGTFAQEVRYQVGDGPWCVASCDLDDDGDLDLVVPIAREQKSGTEVSVLLNNGDGTFADPVLIATGGLSPFWLTVDDLDDDGDCDMAVTNYESNDVSILLNNGDGTFASPIIYTTGVGPAYIASGDLDEDNDLDLVVANFLSDDISLLINNGDGTFETENGIGNVSGALTVAIGDLDNDDDLDLVVNSYVQGGPDIIVVFWNNGNGQFFMEDQYILGNGVASVATGDLDSDNDLDLVVANLEDDTVSVLLNHGNGTFAEDETVLVGDGPRFVALADLDNDNDLDLAVANRLGDQVTVHWNDCTGGSTTIVPDAVTVLRGFQIGGTLEDVFESDDSRMRFNPGITINSAEAPVWLIFDAALPNDNPAGLQIVMESQAGTPGLTGTLEAWNWNLVAYDVVDVSMASFGSDTIVTADLSSGISDYVEAGTGAVRTRVGWRKTGLTIDNPWEVRLDQMVWIAE